MNASTDVRDVFCAFRPRHELTEQLDQVALIDEWTAEIPLSGLVATQETLSGLPSRTRGPIEVARFMGRDYVIEGHHRCADAARSGKTTIMAHVTEYGELELNPIRRTRGRSKARSLDLNRNGFPWPVRTECYHATSATREIAHEGFKTREEGAPEALGGSWTRSVSFTLSLPRAASIALGLETLIRGATRRMSCVELLERLVEETPDGIQGGLTSGYDLQDVVWSGEKKGLGPVDSLLPVFERLDDDWAIVTIFGVADKDESPPPGAVRLTERHWLAPPGTYSGYRYVTDCRKAFYETYRNVLSWADHAEQAFNPHFTGTDMDALAKKSPETVGLILARIMIPRVCTDARGAVRLGYATEEEMKNRPEIRSLLQTASLSCRAALDARSDYDIDRGKVPLGLHRWYDPKVGPYKIAEEGERTRRNTMLFEEREEELVVYATDRIAVDHVVLIEEIRRELRLGDRITFPWFDEREVDVRVVR